MLKIFSLLFLIINIKNTNSTKHSNYQQELKDFILQNQYHTTIPKNKGRVNVSLSIAFRAFDNIDHIDGSINIIPVPYSPGTRLMSLVLNSVL